MRNPLPDRINLVDERTPASRYSLSCEAILELYDEGFAFPSANRFLREMKTAVGELGFVSIGEFLESDIDIGGYAGREDYIRQAYKGGDIGFTGEREGSYIGQSPRRQGYGERGSIR